MKNTLNAKRPALGLQSITVPSRFPSRVPTHSQIEQLAYNLYLQRGKKPGRQLDDWLTAENRLRTILAPE